MKFARFAAGASLASLALFLAACGGEGVNSTPTPTPAPTPSPTPSPTPTPGPTPTPTPSPTPTPTPTSVNDDLVAPLVSESFANDAATGSANYPNSGTSSSSAARSTISIAFNSANQSYTITNGGRSQTFQPSDRDASLSTAEANVYVRNSGSTTDTLYLTTNTASPAAPGYPRYRYVGGGVWQRTVDSGSGLSGSIDAFAYGVATPNAAVPRSGTANYDVTLRGAVAFSDQIGSASSAGKLDVNFSSGKMTGTGELYISSSHGYEIRSWHANADVSANGNAFGGAFGLSDVNSGPAMDMAGSIQGRFYGPHADELGAAWYWKDPVQHITFAGFMLGSDIARYPINSSLRGLMYDEDFIEEGWGYSNTRDVTNGTASGESILMPRSTNSLRPLSFSQDLGALIIDDFPGFTEQPLLASYRDASSSDKTYDVYNFSQTGPNGNPLDTELKIFRPAADNPVIQLTYTSFASWTSTNVDHGTYTNYREGWTAFGQDTPASGIPASGTATYTAAIFGQSELATAGNGRDRTYDITGTGRFVFDFGAATLSGWLHPLMSDPTTSTSYDLGQYDFANTIFSAGTPTFSGKFTKSGELIFAPNMFYGQFTGPHAEELLARWQTATTDPITSQPLDIFGIAVGKR